MIKIGLIILSFICLFSQNKADDILGKWVSHDHLDLIEVVKVEEHYFGYIVKHRDTPEDYFVLLNEKSLKLRNFIFEENEWTEGEVFATLFNKFKSVTLEMDDKNHLVIAVSLFLFSKRVTWTRYDLKERSNDDSITN